MNEASGPSHPKVSAIPSASSSAPVWPAWLPDYPRHSPQQEPYVLAALRMSAPTGRSWQRQRLVENTDLRTRLAPLLGTLPISHSLLQEPHGGQLCRFHHPTVRIWQDPDPDRWPSTLYRQFVRTDGPRQGLGEVTLTLRLQLPEGHTAQFSRTLSECNIRADGLILLTQIPDHLAAP
ncbi:hypothetical protein [Streptomyces sp. SP18CS02]|uniref:hypothetical protein n=1 Tax=Streptomyces sp. SP18CS02 TaxID=3002531 RepID=UPI002E783B00|nr:hypothetical protein [Streptomyces sp. SP18CS02]MEE1752854.1 hypothetical protein [Streptomyces sp. SP18CS02]